jgi:uncharacterized membrane protein
MFSFWFIGFLSILAYRVFYAGMNNKTFYKVSPYRMDNGKMVFDEGKAFGYAFISFVVAIFWMAALPVIGIYTLGKRFNKEK